MSIEQAEYVKKLLQEEGVFKQKNMVVVLTGLMEAGKTTLLHQLFGKNLPDQYTSTGVAERSWRGLTHYTANMKELKLLENPQDMFQLVARVKKIPSDNKIKESTRDERNNAEDLTVVESSTVSAPYSKGKAVIQTKDDNSKSEERGHSSEMQGASKSLQVTGLSTDVNNHDLNLKDKSHSLREFVNMVCKNPNECYGELELVHMIDTGGQPECLMVMPSLIHNANLILLVANLLHHLNEVVTPTFHIDGHKYKKNSLMTSNKEIIEQLAHTMAGRSNTQILIVATHKDKIPEQDLPKVLKDLNRFVTDVLPPESLIAKAKYHVVFDIDLLHPDETLEIIRENIVHVDVRRLEIPPSFVLFENDILHFTNERNGGRRVKVLEFNECIEIGNNLHMTERVVEAALTFFNNNNIFLFFKEIGPGLMFIDPKFLICFVDNIVQLSYMVNEGECIRPSLTMSQIDSLSKGIFTESLLRHKFLAQNFVPDIFKSSHAIEIFKKYFVIAEGSFGQGNYIMMCLLPHLSQKEFQTKANSLAEMSQEVEPLILDFGRKGSPPNWEQCCSPSGCFGGTIACLISNFDWKICTDFDNKEPECLYHEVVMLQPKQIPLKITLINMTKYIKVYVKSKEGGEHKNLFKIRKQIIDAIKEVLKTLKVDILVAEGLQCTCWEKGVFHTLYLLEDPETSQEYLECKHAPKYKANSLWGKGMLTNL